MRAHEPTTMSERPVGCVSACRGCRYRDFSPEGARAIKEDANRARLAPIGPAGSVLPLRFSEPAWGLRRRVLLHVHAGGASTGYRVGLRRRDDELIEIPDCPAHDPRVNRVVADFIGTFPHGWKVRYLHLNERLLTFVMKERVGRSTSELAEWGDGFLRRLGDSLDVRGIFVNFHPAAGNRVFADKGWELLAGEAEARTAAGVVYGAASFLQNHPELHAEALARAREFFGAASTRDLFLDLYCGIGGTAVALGASAFRELVSVELADSVRFARVNAGEREGHVIYRGKVEERLPQIDPHFARARGVVFVNPSRLGLASEVVDWLGRRRGSIERLAYLSCNVASLARDLETLSRAGYRVEEIRPYDFFPMTGHLENLALLKNS